MNKKIIIVSSIILIIGIVILFGLQSSEIKQVDLSENIDEQKIDNTIQERNWRRDVIEPIDLNSEIEDSLYNPVILRSFGDHLFVGDYGDMMIKRFNLDGKYVNRIGIGRGRGPGEFTQFMDFHVSDKTIHILDLNNLMINQFNTEENFLVNSFEVKDYPSRVCMVEDKLVIAGLGGEKLFSVFDRSGNKLTEFGEVITNQVSNSLSVQGNVVAIDEEPGFIFVPSYASYLFYYNLKGETKKIIRTIDQREFPQSPQSGAGESRTVSAPQTDMIAEAISKSNGMLYILFLKKNDEDAEKIEAFIDVYNLKEGKYSHSFELPVTAREIALKNDSLYVIRDGDKKILAYHLNL